RVSACCLTAELDGAMQPWRPIRPRDDCAKDFRYMARHERRSPLAPTSRATAGIASAALLLAGCSLFSGGDPEADPVEPDQHTVVPAATAAEEPVQDTWVFERVRTVPGAGSLVDVPDRLLAGLVGDEVAALELVDGVTFTPVP